MNPPVRLVALDVDGTLLRSDGTIAPEDRAAITRARAAGVVVTLATGRLTTSACEVARQLELQDPLVCADGAVLFCPRRGQAIHQTNLGAAAVSRLLVRSRDRGLSPFVFTHDAVHGAVADTERFPWVAGWTPDVVRRDQLETAVTGPGALPLVIAIGVGPEDDVRQVERQLCDADDPAGREETAVFPIGETGDWVVRLQPRGCTKATGLALLAQQMNIGPENVLAMGDWFNDVPMLIWAGHSFAMGQSPPGVQEAAKQVLRASAGHGGGVAEALTLLHVI